MKHFSPYIDLTVQMASITVATYLPESMLVTIGPDLRVLDEDGKILSFPSARSFSWFYHEYVHYLHSISTTSGLALLINTIELWRSFRATFDGAGKSTGSAGLSDDNQGHIGRLLKYLGAARSKRGSHAGNLAVGGEVKLLSALTSTEVEGDDGTLLSVLVCEVEMSGSDGTFSPVTVKVGLPELLEGAAWLLERRMALAVDRNCEVVLPAFFPYRVAQFTAEVIAPGIDEDAVLACMLGALQSTDPPQAFFELVDMAAQAIAQQKDALAILRQAVGNTIALSAATIEQQISILESEFSDGMMARAVREILSVARRGLALRRGDPFFEASLIDDIKSGRKTPALFFGDILPCMVLQKNIGSDDQIERDFLLSFHPNSAFGEEIDSGQQLILCIFHLLRSHVGVETILRTEILQARQCPFYKCCDLELRRREPNVCQSVPWQAADWAGWNKAACSYAIAVRVTRPPPSA